MNPRARVLVIIVTWNKKSYVLDLLASVSRLSCTDQQLDILVVDNASSDGTVAAVKRQYPHVRIMANKENLGGCGGFNTGLSWAFAQPEEKYEYLWLLDNDVQVHQQALSELARILDRNPLVAVAGSTMMQLTVPWRINEMGAGVDRDSGSLLLYRHCEDVSDLKSRPLSELLGAEIDLTPPGREGKPWQRVEYVAAASLLVRASVARQAGLWEDFFIHFDDVEWCLRIGDMGHGIAVSYRSLIWHLPAENKVPSWTLYYDNRNILYLLEKHGNPGAVARTKRRILKKSLYYALLGKNDLSRLHLEALEDFSRGKTGKKRIRLEDCYLNSRELRDLVGSLEGKSVLLPWTVDPEKFGLGGLCEQAAGHQGVHIDVLLPGDGREKNDVPCPGWTGSVVCLSTIPWIKFLRLWRLRNRYDIVLLSDHTPVPMLSWLGGKLLFMNLEGGSLRPSPSLPGVLRQVWRIVRCGLSGF